MIRRVRASTTKTPRLNCWYQVLPRRFILWLNRQYMAIRPARRRELSREVMVLVSPRRKKTDADDRRIATLHWRLGIGSPYRFTADQLKAQDDIAREIIDEILAEEAITEGRASMIYPD